MPVEIVASPSGADDVVGDLWALASSSHGPSLSAWMEEHGTCAHARELAIHRSSYQLKEADPHTRGIPRLAGRAKAAMVAIQADEYGQGDPAAMQAALLARTMELPGLLADEPELAADVVFGARTRSQVESQFSGNVHDRWASGRCSLRHDLGALGARRCAATGGGPPCSAPGHVLPGNVLVGSRLSG